MFEQKWKLSEDYSVAENYEFLKQPQSNSWDRGVLVCLYIWSVIVGDSFSEYLDINEIPDATNCFIQKARISNSSHFYWTQFKITSTDSISNL